MGTLGVTAGHIKKFIELFEQTPTRQVQDIFESGLLADFRDFNIAGVNREEFQRLGGFKPLASALLMAVGTVAVPARTECFVAQEKFVVGSAGIVRISDNFNKWFLPKVEGPVAKATFCYAKLLKSSLDGPIIDELGNAKETTLAGIYSLMERPGVLLTNGYANIFYVRDVNGKLRAVFVHRSSDGWSVSATFVADPNRWDDSSRVFSRNSC